MSVTLAIIVPVATDTVNLPHFVCLHGRPSVKTMLQMLSDTELSLGLAKEPSLYYVSTLLAIF